MTKEWFHKVYFIGIGGIGMSALARYYSFLGMDVGGYDKTQTPLTIELEALGIMIHYQDDVSQIPSQFRIPKRPLWSILQQCQRTIQSITILRAMALRSKKDLKYWE